MQELSIPPGLEPRFQQPEGWRWHSFERNGHTLRFGTVSPPGHRPEAAVVALQGLSEFAEKYYEVAHDCLKRNFSFWMMDWRGQGKSQRYLANPEKRHAQPFGEDVADLHHFVMEYVQNSAVMPDEGRIPLIMLGHSMGGNLGLRYLHDHSGVFACAALTAPMAGIHRLDKMPSWLQRGLTMAFKGVAGTAYAFGAGNWLPLDERGDNAYFLSGDPVRGHVADRWYVADKGLRVGFITFEWLYQAMRSNAIVLRDAPAIKTPVLIALAGLEATVSNTAARVLAQSLPHCTLVDFETAKHEILMERDDIRNAFFSQFDGLIARNVIMNKPVPF